MPEASHSLILLFDGYCNFCNGWVNFIFRNDRKKKFRFAPLQSDAGKKLLDEYKVPSQINSAVLIDKGKAYIRADVGLRIMKHLGGIYYPVYFLSIVPSFIHTIFYDLVANNRYRFWGKRNDCIVPTEEMKERFLQSLPLGDSAE